MFSQPPDQSWRERFQDEFDDYPGAGEPTCEWCKRWRNGDYVWALAVGKLVDADAPNKWGVCVLDADDVAVTNCRYTCDEGVFQ